MTKWRVRSLAAFFPRVEFRATPYTRKGVIGPPFVLGTSPAKATGGFMPLAETREYFVVYCRDSTLTKGSGSDPGPVRSCTPEVSL